MVSDHLCSTVWGTPLPEKLTSPSERRLRHRRKRRSPDGFRWWCGSRLRWRRCGCRSQGSGQVVHVHRLPAEGDGWRALHRLGQLARELS